MTVVLAVVLQVANATLMWRIHHTHRAPAENGGNNRGRTDASAFSQ